MWRLRRATPNSAPHHGLSEWFHEHSKIISSAVFWTLGIIILLLALWSIALVVGLIADSWAAALVSWGVGFSFIVATAIAVTVIFGGWFVLQILAQLVTALLIIPLLIAVAASPDSWIVPKSS